jgi:phage tail-like protein
MAHKEDANLGLSNRFSVVVEPGKYELGSFGKIEGLDVTWEMPEYRAGDAGNYRWFLPGFTKYSTIKLSRSVSAKDSPQVMKWLSAHSMKPERWQITIELKGAAMDGVVRWTCEQALPLKWSIPPFDASTSKIAVETLEFSHLGFLEDHKL